MRAVLTFACALVLLSGCGRNSSDSPQAATNPSKDGTNPQQKGAPHTGDPGAGTKQGNPADAAGPGFSASDPQQTLGWLIRSAAKLRATAPGDQAALDREWAAYTQAVKAASGQKIRWELLVDQAPPKETGVITETVKSPADPACRGLRLMPDQQPAGFTTFILEVPAAERAGLRPGSRVLVSGVVAQIDTDLGKSHPNAPTYVFHVRLRDYTVSPVK
jgi:hypothetical protein